MTGDFWLFFVVLIEHQASIRELEHTVKTLSDHVKYLAMNSTGPLLNLQQAPARNSPGASIPSSQPPLSQLHLRQQNQQQTAPVTSDYSHKLGTLPQQLQQAPQQAQPQTWYRPALAAPQASHPATLPQAPPPPLPQAQPRSQQTEIKTTPDTSDTWESVFLPAVLSEDLRDLQILLARTNADVVMPLEGPGPLSQPVILTAMHRVCSTPLIQSVHQLMYTIFF